MTPQQLATLKAYILATPELAAQPMTSGGALLIAEALNAPASPAFIVWRTNVSQDEIMQNGFDWVRVDNLSVGKARIWEWMFDNGSASVNPSKANVRAGIDECWSGAANVAIRAAIYAHCKRPATIAEHLLATGTGTDATPAMLGFEGQLTADDVAQARES